MPVRNKRSSLLGPFLSWKDNKVLWKRATERGDFKKRMWLVSNFEITNAQSIGSSSSTVVNIRLIIPRSWVRAQPDTKKMREKMEDICNHWLGYCDFFNIDCSNAECRYSECHYSECYYSECHYSECHYSEFRYSECCYSECHYTEWNYSECSYSECLYSVWHYSECHYSECCYS